MSPATYTALVQWDHGDGYPEREEVDVTASTEPQARAAVEAELRANYQPGGSIVRIVRRPAGILFF